ncbi:MAG TPA: phage integrase N-terminal SAM-like domain-containing protein [Alkalispirochaeta sp.]|nr:phage integrase N-terminal SAM-like domain-containing protein [Alkalispirochaeta sp.]
MTFEDQEGFEWFLREDKGFEKQVIPWMVRWVGGFLSGLESSKHWDQRCREYYGELEQRVAGWQYAQAAKSVQLYLEFRRRSNPDIPASQAGSWEQAEQSAKREIRRQSKALQTEKTYMYWIIRFRNHTGTPQPDRCSTEHVKDFLTWLAVEKRVSVATQNQAFNALLFLYRFVLGGSIGDLKAIPLTCLSLLDSQLATSRTVFEKDRRADRPGVALPTALESKYPNAGLEIAWFWVFPAPRESVDLRTGIDRRHHLYSSSLQKAFKGACRSDHDDSHEARSTPCLAGFR